MKLFIFIIHAYVLSNQQVCTYRLLRYRDHVTNIINWPMESDIVLGVDHECITIERSCHGREEQGYEANTVTDPASNQLSRYELNCKQRHRHARYESINVSVNGRSIGPVNVRLETSTQVTFLSLTSHP